MASLQEALAFFNTDIPQWYKWIDTKNGEVYSNLELRVEEAVMPTEEQVNAKIAELTVIQNRQDAYDAITDQLDKLYHDMTADKLDVTGEWYKAVKKVKDDNPKG